MIRKLWLAFLFLAVLQLSAEPPKYVFYLIGDGMGKNHVEFGEKFFGGLQMKTLPVKGSLVTSNIQRSTTDSAAAGTALALRSENP